MKPFEQLGVFYLGRRIDPENGASGGEPVLYDSRDLTTHAVIVGMTGSGKTGLGIALLEEALIDRVPIIAVDPKGDLPNLLLTLPDLGVEAFLPWVGEDEAAAAGVDRREFAARQAELWRRGLADWGQDGARIRRLQESAEFTVYTPGSRAGRPVNLLGGERPAAAGRAGGCRPSGRPPAADGDGAARPRRSSRRPGDGPRAHSRRPAARHGLGGGALDRSPRPRPRHPAAAL